MVEIYNTEDNAIIFSDRINEFVFARVLNSNNSPFLSLICIYPSWKQREDKYEIGRKSCLITYILIWGKYIRKRGL